MDISGIIEKVRALLNEVGSEENLILLSEDTLKLDTYIQSVIPDAINTILAIVPLKYANINNSTISAQITEDGTILNLPLDYCRFVAVKLNEWKREVQLISPYGSDIYKIQHNPITRSGKNKPCCVYANSLEGNVIECFPVGTLEYFKYVKNISTPVSDDELKGINDELFPSICYMCASLVYSIFENPTTADRMKQLSIELMPKE